tara:strand:+ start:241 stop:471 length:231 start_codon:yes stop_codon:yes gene_type:complete
MPNTIKKHQLKIITLNNTKYFGYLLHQLPKNYEEISMLDQFNLGGFTYISEYAVELTKNQLDTRTSNVALGNLKTI